MKKNEFEICLKNYTYPDAFEKIKDIHPCIARMEHYDQHHPYHNLDLLEHSVATMRNLRIEDLSPEERNRLMVAAFLHDIGKPDSLVVKYNILGQPRNTFPGHPEKSAKIANEILDALGYGKEDKEYILFYIACHDLFMNFSFSAKGKLAINEHNVKRVYERAHEKFPFTTPHDFFALMHLSVADALAHNPQVIDVDGSIKDTNTKMAARAKAIQDIFAGF